MQNAEPIRGIKSNKLLLRKTAENKINKKFVDKVNFQNVLTVYSLTKVFNLQNLTKKTLPYIESCFTMLVETQNFLQLGYSLAAEILGSNNLHITSELEVLNSANSWLSYDIKNRKKFAKNILLKVRLTLLSDRTLEYILKKYSTFTKVAGCATMLKEILKNKENVIETRSRFYYTHRYCSHSKFDFVVFGGKKKSSREVVRDVQRIDGSNLKRAISLPSLTQERYNSKSVCLKGEVYVFGGLNVNFELLMSVEKYSLSTKTWNKIADIYDYRVHYCICAFMDKILFFGGRNRTFRDNHITYTYTDSCLQFDTKHKQWKEVSRMNEIRSDAACAVFEERVVIAGGSRDGRNQLSSVESYDVIADEWSPMPNMINRKTRHGLVVVKSKLFVVGERLNDCEVFDNNFKHFVSLKTPGRDVYYLYKAIPFGSKFFVFADRLKAVWCYDVDTGKWSTKYHPHNMLYYSCVKIPCWF